MKIHLLFIIIVLSYSCNTISDTEKLEEYGDYLDQFESYEYNVSHKVYRNYLDKTTNRNGTAYYSVNPDDSILGIKYYISMESNGRKFKSFYDGNIQTTLVLKDSVFVSKTPALLPFNRRMSNPLVTESYHTIKRWIDTNSVEGIFQDLQLKDTIIDYKKCDLFSFNIDFCDYMIWSKAANKTVNNVRIAFDRKTKIPVYFYSRENLSSENFHILKVKFSNFHRIEYNDEKLSIKSVPDGFHWYSGGKMLPCNSLAPDFTIPSLEGDSIQLSDLKGTYVLIEFAYIGCGPCIKSIPKLNDIQNIYKAENLKVYGINLNCSNPKKISEYKINRGIEYDILWSDTDFFAKKYLVASAPTIYLIDDYGRIIYSSIGFKEDELKAELMEIFGT